MLKSVLDVFAELEEILQQRDEAEFLPNCREKIQEMHDLFAPVKSATEILSASKKPTMHLVVPVYYQLMQHFKNIVPSEHADIRALQDHALTVFQSKLQPDDAHKMAVFLNPAMKHMNFFPAADRPKIVAAVMREIQLIQINNNNEAVISTAEFPKQKGLFDFSSLCKFSTEQITENEVEKYARMPSPPPKQDLFQFWQQNEKELPRLFRFAQRLLAVPSSSTPSERLFSHTGDAVSEKRTRLSPDTLSDLMLIRWNYLEEV